MCMEILPACMKFFTMHGVLKGQKWALDLLEPELQRIKPSPGPREEQWVCQSLNPSHPSEKNPTQYKKVAGLRKSLFKNKNKKPSYL